MVTRWPRLSVLVLCMSMIAISSGAHSADQKAKPKDDPRPKSIYQVQSERYASKQEKAYLGSDYSTVLAASNSQGTTTKYWVVAEVWTDDGQHLFVGDLFHPEPSWDHVPTGEIHLADIQNLQLRIVKIVFHWKLTPSIFEQTYDCGPKESSSGNYFKVAAVAWSKFNDCAIVGVEAPLP